MQELRSVRGKVPEAGHQLRLLDAEDARHPSPHLNAATHPELLAVASLLLAARHRATDVERESSSRLGFPFQASADDPLTMTLREHEKGHLH